MTDDYLAGLINKSVYFASNIPVFGNVFRAVDTMRYYDDYMANTGVSWSDVRYPTRLNSSGFSGLTNFVSKNIERLYR